MSWLSDYFSYLQQLFTQLELPTRATFWSFKKTLAYAIATLLLTSLLVVVRYQIKVLPVMFSEISGDIAESSNYFPADAILNWNGSELSLTGVESLDVPNNYTFLPQPPFTTHLLKIAPQLQKPEELDATQPKPWILFGKNQAWIYDLDQNWSSVPLQQLLGADAAFQVTQSNYPDYQKQGLSALRGFEVVTRAAVTLVLPIAYTLVRLIVITLDSIWIFFLLRLFVTSTLTFKKAWQLSLQIGLVAGMIGVIAEFIYPGTTTNLTAISFWLLFILVSLGIKKYTWKIKASA